MPEIRPFRAIRYDPSIVGPLDAVIAPPYDVISKADQDRLYEQSPYNVVRIDLARDADRYASARATWEEWLSRGVLRRDDEAAFYAYAQRHVSKTGEAIERLGFFARLHLEDFASGKVRPHERTLPSAKQDRLELQRACRANLSPIFGLYVDREATLRERIAETLSTSPLATIRDALGVENRLWRVTREEPVRAICAALADRTVYIADGHHRYETALRYRDEMRAATGKSDGRQPFDWVLAFLCNAAEPGLTVLPTHRLLRTISRDAGSLVAELAKRFTLTEHADRADFLAALHGVPPGERRLGLVLRDRPSLAVLATRDGDHDGELTGSTPHRRLDVTLLHDLVLGPLLGIEAHAAAEKGELVYVKDDDEAIDRTRDGEFAAAFLMNATRVEEVFAVSEAGETMPEKSTYFFPKVLSGLVFNGLDEA
jgi:uncharacterized protein (DUF1015 family)